MHHIARRVSETLDDGELFEKHLTAMRRVMVSLPINTVTLRRNIADVMIQYGRYSV
jgi:hypothetical protein